VRLAESFTRLIIGLILILVAAGLAGCHLYPAAPGVNLNEVLHLGR
jgi:hypothetical protein